MRRESGWVAVLIASAVVMSLADTGGFLPNQWWYVPWGLSLVLFGLPHGAIDHEIVIRLWHPQPPPRWALPVTLAAYLLLSLIVLGGWFAAPALVFGGFILLTTAHWGLADLWWSWHRDPPALALRLHRIIFALWRGTLPMLMPLVVDPHFYRVVAESTCNLFTREPFDFGWLESDVTRQSALATLVVLGTADLAFSCRALRRSVLNLVEGLGLVLFFSVLPAIASIGLYFAFWHGLRHILRLRGMTRLTWLRFIGHATPATIGAVVMLGLLAWRVPLSGPGEPLLGVYLALIAALTVPHALVVSWQDLRDGLWK